MATFGEWTKMRVFDGRNSPEIPHRVLEIYINEASASRKQEH